MKLTEDLLYYVWKFRLFKTQSLITSNCDPVEILSPGIRNGDAGPDFEQAKIRIGDTVWVGSVEMHCKASDWHLHNHTTDKAYNNVVLHVVYYNDQEILRTDGSKVPTLSLEGLIPDNISSNYQALMENLNWIPCEKILQNIDQFHVRSWLSRVLIERLEDKCRVVFSLLQEYKGSWDDSFYVMLARGFGFKTNALPFELLARTLPQTVLAKHKNHSLQIEALIFGQSGFLHEGGEDEYQMELFKEYNFLKLKYQLEPIDNYLWKFMRLRPQNFPTIRLAQFAALILKSSHLFSKIVAIEDIKEIRKLFANLPVNPYWDTHYRFGKQSSKAYSSLGTDSINNILLNVVVLFIFAYGKHTKNALFVERAIALLEDLPFETNHITTCFKELGLRNGGAETSQALLQLKKVYCDNKKCLDCGIGIKLIN